MLKIWEYFTNLCVNRLIIVTVFLKQKKKKSKSLFFAGWSLQNFSWCYRKKFLSHPEGLISYHGQLETVANGGLGSSYGPCTEYRLLDQFFILK